MARAVAWLLGLSARNRHLACKRARGSSTSDRSRNFCRWPPIASAPSASRTEGRKVSWAGHATRTSLEIYSRLALADAQHTYDSVIDWL